MKKLRLVIIVLILIAFNTCYSFVDKTEKIYNSDISSGSYTNVGGMTEDYSVTQEFYCSYDNLSELSLRFATFDRVNKGNIEFVIVEKSSDKEVANGSLDTSKIINNEFNSIRFNTIKDSKDKQYLLKLKAVGIEGDNVITVYSTLPSDKDNILTINDRKISKSALVMKVNCEKILDIETFIVLVCFELYVAFFLKLLYKYLA